MLVESGYWGRGKVLHGDQGKDVLSDFSLHLFVRRGGVYSPFREIV